MNDRERWQRHCLSLLAKVDDPVMSELCALLSASLDDLEDRSRAQALALAWLLKQAPQGLNFLELQLQELADQPEADGITELRDLALTLRGDRGPR